MLDLSISKGVRRKLCALSLTARAQHGELPLPMPTILRRPTHMILVTGMTPNGLNNVQEASNDDFLSPLKSSAASNSKQNSAGSENGINRLNNRRFNGANGGEGSSSARIQMNRTCGLIGTDDESRKLMETKFQVSPRIPKWVGVIERMNSIHITLSWFWFPHFSFTDQFVAPNRSNRWNRECFHRWGRQPSCHYRKRPHCEVESDLPTFSSLLASFMLCAGCRTSTVSLRGNFQLTKAVRLSRASFLCC